MKIAVLGAGNGGCATAADLALAGHRVRLWSRSADALGPLADNATITLEAEGRHGAARLERATTDLGEAVEGAEILIAPLPATSHEDLAKRLAPCLNDRQIVLLTPGSLGSYAMARAIARAGGTLPLALAETGTLPYLARKTAPAVVKAPVRAANLPIGVFPASRGPSVVPRLAELFPAVRPCVDALDRLIDAVDAERLATRRGWGYPAPHYELETYYDDARAAEGLYGVGAKTKLVASGLWSEILTFEHRYVTEDVALGLALFESAARAAGAATAAVTGLLLVFGALLGRELSGGGRALEHLGLGDFSRREIRAFLQDGWASTAWRKVIQ